MKLNEETPSHEKQFPHERRNAPRRVRCERYFVTFRKPAHVPVFVEVTVVANSRKHAHAMARDIVRPIAGLIPQGVD